MVSIKRLKRPEPAQEPWAKRKQVETRRFGAQVSVPDSFIGTDVPAVLASTRHKRGKLLLNKGTRVTLTGDSIVKGLGHRVT